MFITIITSILTYVVYFNFIIVYFNLLFKFHTLYEF